MSCPANGPCQPFATQLDLCCLVTGAFPDPCITDTNTPVAQEIIDNALEAASEVLWAATGRQYGTCTVKIRPCQQGGACNPCPDGGELPFFGQGDFGYGSGFPWYPLHTEAGWINVRPCGCTSSCGCDPLCEVQLPYPVCCIDEVKINGAVLGASQYRVDDFKRLVRLGPSTTKLLATDLVEIVPTLFQLGDFRLSGAATAFTGPDQYGLSGITDAGQGFSTSTFGTSASDLDLSFDIETDSFGALFDLAIGTGQPNFTVEVLQGGMTVSIVGPTITVGPWTDNQIPGIIRITSHNTPTQLAPPHLTSVFTNASTPLIVLSASWTDTTTGACWPTCQDLTLADTEDDTFSITVTYGRTPPTLVKMATATLACEFIKACVGQPCQLPQRIQSISRQGVTVGFLDPMDFIQQGRTGIYLVDLAISKFNPKGLLKQASVYSPDLGKRWTRTDTGSGGCT